MLESLKRIFGKNYHPLNSIEISRSALVANYQYLSGLMSGVSVAPVLKSNAYGHGIVEVAKILDQLHPPFFCVDSIYEAYELMKAGILSPILIMGYVHPESLAVKKLPFSYAVFTREMLQAVKKYQPHAHIHIFVDTGMNREGVSINELAEFLDEATDMGLNIEGLMSHLAKGDDPKDPGTHRQMENFVRTKQIFKEKGIIPRFLHLAASSGLLHSEELGDIGNVARTGIALYGIDPEGENKKLKPALELHTTVAQVKKIEKGAKVGYDFTFTAKKTIALAVLPIGYNDGVDRRLSNKGKISISGNMCPIVGRVSMNITLADVTGLDIRAGQKAIVYSREQNQNSVFAAARDSGTIPYELLVHLHSSMRRIVVYSST